MTTRLDLLDTLSTLGAELENNQRVADLFAASPHKSAPINPLNGQFVVGEFGGIVDTVKGTLPEARAPEAKLNYKFNTLNPLPDAPDLVADLQTSTKFNPTQKT